ncbi:hypothetical protein, partial [Novipirellula maiorica]|uniref:hypothetical protein n=1 Tax=Novipirellula maiorica TaxID=1265734 RepID=UPI001F3CEFA5
RVGCLRLARTLHVSGQAVASALAGSTLTRRGLEGPVDLSQAALERGGSLGDWFGGWRRGLKMQFG